MLKNLGKLMSPPLWVRGLKSVIKLNKTIFVSVAPFMGAWIEIKLFCNIFDKIVCRTLYGCVD